MKKFIFAYLIVLSLIFNGCKKEEHTFNDFTKISSISLGIGSPEISAYDKITKRLFVVNTNKKAVDVIDVSNPSNPFHHTSISITQYGGNLNSVAVNDGLLAIAVEGNDKAADKGNVVVFKTDNLNSHHLLFEAGYLPDMVTFTPNGKFILSANEGEPNDDYSIDPPGSITIVDLVRKSAKTLTFDAFAGQYQALKKNHFRVFGQNSNGVKSSFSQDVEPEYIAVSANSKTAWVTLQENNGLAKINIETQSIVDIYGLGIKDYSKLENSVDLSDKDGRVALGNSPVKSYFQPDAIDCFQLNGIDYLVLANEGDSRDYSGFSEELRVSDLVLDSVRFPNYKDLQLEKNLGRLKVTNTSGDIDGDGDFDEIYGYGGRSFSIRDEFGQLVYDSKNELIKRSILLGSYPEGRSDDKGVEPEGIVAFSSHGKSFIAVGLERSGDVLIYNVDNPEQPSFVQSFANTSPEGLIVISAVDSPNGKDLLIVSNEEPENAGMINIYSR